MISPDDLLAWLPLLACVAPIAQAALGRQPANTPTTLGALGVLASFAVAAVVAPKHATAAVWVAFTVLVLVPVALAHLANRLLRRHDYAGAAGRIRLLLTCAPWNHRTAWSGQLRVLDALALAARGRMEEAEAAFAAIIADPAVIEPARSSALIGLCRLRDDWTPLLGEDEEERSASQGRLMGALRGLAETGSRNRLVRLYAAGRGRMGGQRWPAALYVVTACGEPEAAEALLDGPLAELPGPYRAYWQALAALSAGRVDAGRAVLSELTAGSDRLLALAAARRLGSGVEAETLGPQERGLLAREVAAIPAEAPRAPASLLDAPVTLALIGLNVAMFAAEMLAGGSEDDDVLSRLGALWPASMLGDGEWHRLVTALFLHAGPAHLALNMVGLAVVGVRAEAAFGPARTLLSYFAGGLASTGGVLLLGALGLIAQGLLVGASGAIMGLVGALLVDLARNGRRAIPSRAERWFLVLVAPGQVLLDLLMPRNSLAAHLFGFVAGAFVALVPAAARSTQAPVLARSRRRALAALAGLAAALGGVEIGPIRRARAVAAAPAPEPFGIDAADLACIRALRFVWIPDVEGGGPSVDPAMPFGSRDALSDIGRLTGEKGPALWARYVRVMDRVPDFAAAATLTPGIYALAGGPPAGLRRGAGDDAHGITPDGRFAFTEAHGRLIRGMIWDVLGADGDDRPHAPLREPRSPAGAWRVASIHFKRPFGDMTFFEIDMADILGQPPLASDVSGREIDDPERVAALDALYASLPAALDVFVANAVLRGSS